jgi:hypothetical protein
VPEARRQPGIRVERVTTAITSTPALAVIVLVALAALVLLLV